MQTIIRQVAAELRVREPQVQAAVDLLDGGATVPFVARYRKEATGGLDDIQLRELVKTGDIVKVQVMEIDVARKRIALSMKLGDAPANQRGARDNRFERAARGQRAPRSQPADTAMAGAFAKPRGLRK